MIGEVVAYAANRATGGAVDSISRRAGWYVAGGLIFLFGAMFAIMAAFWYLEPRYGTIQSAAAIAAVCIFSAIMCFAVPGAVETMKKRRAQAEVRAAATAAGVAPASETAQAVHAEAVEAVDFFGPFRVMLTAFMFGMGVAKQAKQFRR